MSGKVVRELAMALFFAACGSADQPETPNAAFCDGLCKAVARCGFDDPACESECIEQRPQLTAMSLDGAKRMGECVSGFDCSTLTTDSLWQPAFESCWDDVRIHVAPTAQLRSFCQSFAEAWFECGA